MFQPGSPAVAVKPDGKQFLVTSSTPAKVGDVLIIYCAGLGPVTPAVVAGTASPLSPLSGTVDQVSVTIGGQSATVFLPASHRAWPAFIR